MRNTSISDTKCNDIDMNILGQLWPLHIYGTHGDRPWKLLVTC